MASLYHSLFTEKGLELLRTAIQSGTKLGITHMSFGDGNGVLPTPDAKFTQMVKEVYRVALNRLAPSKENANWLEADGVIPSAVGGFNIREVGLWAGNVMVAYANYPPTYKPTGDQGTAQIKTIRIVLQIDNTANFELKIDASVVMATIQSVNDAKQEIYSNTVSNVKSVSDLIDLQTWENRIVRTSSFHENLGKGSATYRYDSEKKDINNGTTCINGWCLDELTPNIYQFGAYGDGIHNDTLAIQAMFDYSSYTNKSPDDDIQTQNYKTKRRKAFVPRGQYRFTKPLIIGGAAYIEFENPNCSFFFDKNNSAVLIADLDNIFDFAIKTANFDSNGNLLKYDKFVSGDEFDQQIYSQCSAITLDKIALIANKQIYGGLKLSAAPQSKVTEFYIVGFDYCIVTSSSWTSRLEGMTQHYKCGVLCKESDHNILISGYFDPVANGKYLDGPDLYEHVKECKIGVLVLASHGAKLSSVTAEYNDYNIACIWTSVTVSSLYSEACKIASVYSSAAKVTIDTIMGSHDARIFEIRNNSRVKLSNFGSINFGTLEPIFSDWEDEINSLIVDETYNYYHKNIFVENMENILYVSSAGNDHNLGLNEKTPVKSLDEVFKRITDYPFNKSRSIKEFKVVILDNETYKTNFNVVLDETRIKFETKNQSIIPIINFDYLIQMNNCELTFENININLLASNVPWTIFRSYAYNNKVSLFNCSITIEGQRQLITITEGSCMKFSVKKSKIIGLWNDSMIMNTDTNNKISKGRAKVEIVLDQETVLNDYFSNQQNSGFHNVGDICTYSPFTL